MWSTQCLHLVHSLCTSAADPLSDSEGMRRAATGECDVVVCGESGYAQLEGWGGVHLVLELMKEVTRVVCVCVCVSVCVTEGEWWREVREGEGGGGCVCCCCLCMVIMKEVCCECT